MYLTRDASDWTLWYTRLPVLDVYNGQTVTVRGPGLCDLSDTRKDGLTMNEYKSENEYKSGIWTTAAIPLITSTVLFCGISDAHNVAPAGFVSLFDGKTLDGWRGRPHFDPREEAQWDNTKRKEKQAEWDADRDQHWSVDTERGEIVSDGHGVFLTPERDYGDFEMYVDWKLLKKSGDSGVYLRGNPQVQIWNPENENTHNLGSDRGSGALWNNNDDNPGKWPLVVADNPVGEWNTFHIRMVGARVWVWFNDQLTVNGAIMDNYFDRDLPMFASGCIQLQTHGSETRFRNIFIREIPVEEANQILRDHGGDRHVPIFNGRDLTGWTVHGEDPLIVDGAIIPSKGTIFTNKQYGDFSVQLEFQLPPAGNNGLAIRYPGKGSPHVDGMCELQVLDSEHSKYTTLDPRQYHGSAYGIAAAHRGYLRPTGEWNFQRVVVQGSEIRVELNGSIILDCDVKDVTEFLGNSNHPGLHLVTGHFGFCGHGDKVAFQNIEIKQLDAP